MFRRLFRSTPHTSRKHQGPRLELLEDRLAPATFVVNSVADPGNGVCDAKECTLREAITQANAEKGADTIVFDIPGDAPHRIQVRSALPVITDAVVIDGASEPDYQGTPIIILDGSSEPVQIVNGLEITAGDSTVRGLVISYYTGTGLILRNGGNNRVEGNYIGTNVSGTLPNRNLRGGVVVFSSNGNVIGGTTTAVRNVISANEQDGIALRDNASNNRIHGNYIGTTANGNGGLGNFRFGILIIDGSRSNLFGTDGDGVDDAAERNVISANGADGLGFGVGTRDNVVAGNYIGITAAGTMALGNAGAGVLFVNGSQFNRVGTNGDGSADEAERNVISANRQDGVLIVGAGTNGQVVAGNYIGLNAAGTAALGNAQDGVEVVNGSQGNRIGTNGDNLADEMERNVISANGFSGIAIKNGSSNNVVAGNYIGTNAAGTVALGNLSQGIYMDGRSDFVRIGTNGNGVADVAERNVISGNGGTGVALVNVRSTRVAGNYIGTNAAGTAALGNGGRCGFPGCDGVGIDQGSQFNVIGTNGDSADNEAERNVISGNSFVGVYLRGTNTSFNVVAGNFIGTDVTGRQRMRNGWFGVYINQASQNRIGTDSNGLADLIERNVIGATLSYQGFGVAIQSANRNTVAGNYIGTDVTGTVALDFPSNVYGVGLLDGASNNMIGGTGPLAGNLISANTIGVLIHERATATNILQGNLIGTRADGVSRLGNLTHGILVTRGAGGNTIGGVEPGEANIIAFNGGSGVVVADGFGISIRGNAIHTNVGLGIDLTFDGVTPNDPLDEDAGPNQLQNFPVLTQVRAGATTAIVGTLQGTPGRTFLVDFYASLTADSTGYGQAERYLGTLTVTTNENGDAVLVGSLEALSSAGEWITATATDELGNTSEFSLAMQAEPGEGEGSEPGQLPDLRALLALAAEGRLPAMPGLSRDRETPRRLTDAEIARQSERLVGTGERQPVSLRNLDKESLWSTLLETAIPWAL